MMMMMIDDDLMMIDDDLMNLANEKEKKCGGHVELKAKSVN